MSDDFDYIPEWGKLPVEQYLIDPASPETTEHQRKTLISQFLQLDEIPREWDCTNFGDNTSAAPSRIPTEDEVAHILQPWRSQKLRNVAWKIWTSAKQQPLILRTYYSPEHDKLVEGWYEISGSYEDEAWWSILNDKEVFDFGENWKRLFYILPEAARDQDSHRRTTDEEFLKDPRAIFKDSLGEAKRFANDYGGSWKDDLNASLLQQNRDAWGLLLINSIWYIFVADEETFRTNLLLLVYYDAKQNVVAQGRLPIDMEYIEQTTMFWERGIPSMNAFEEGSIGEKYLIDGEIGRELYQLTKEDLEDEPTMEGSVKE
ncbi:hypothetical protein BDV06DRAFT_227828 [Aspergillus oleicola]